MISEKLFDYENTLMNPPEESEEIRFRNPVKGVGFVMLSHVITLDPELSDGAYRTYATYIMYAQQNDKCWPGRDRMASDRQKGEATITRHNQELESLGYITRERRLDTSSITWIEDPESNPRLVKIAKDIQDSRQLKNEPNVQLKNEPTYSSKMSRRTAQKCAVEEEPIKKNQRTIPPIGGKGWVVFDLDDVAYEMEGTGRRKEDLTAQCECGAQITQKDNACPDCTLPVVWLNSPTWKKLYGDPHAYLRNLDGEDLKAETPLQREVCKTFYRKYVWPNITTKKSFKSIERNYPDDFILYELRDFAAGKSLTALISAVKNPSNYENWIKKQRVVHDVTPDGREIVSVTIF